jgi:3-hydroxyacyl-[acyl-carrier-protein] dehydratase
MSDAVNFTAKDILNHLPHRPPFLFVDKVVAMDDAGIEVMKQVSFNEPYFQGHFPSMPIMPGVLMIEAMAQAAGIYMVAKHNVDINESNPVYLASVKQARFKQVVTPGDSVHFKVSLVKNRGAVWQFAGEAYVNDQLVAQAEFINMVGEAPQ